MSSPEPIDIMPLFKRYPIMSQGMLWLKNDSATIQLHFLHGSLNFGHRILFEQPTTHVADGIINWSVPSWKMKKKMSIEKPEVSLKLTSSMINFSSEACISPRKNV